MKAELREAGDEGEVSPDYSVVHLGATRRWLGTFLLVLDTRRATLRQINASQIHISERLERLQALREREPPVLEPPSVEHSALGLLSWE